jgi:hypothetical protein
MSICFGLAQFPLDTINQQALALAQFDLVNKKKFDLSGDASKGAVWKAGAKGLEPLMHPSLKSKGVLFLVEVHFGLYPTYKSDTKYLAYEALLNGQRYAITFKLLQDGSLSASGWVPFSVQKIAEFSAVKSNTGGKVQPPSSSVSAPPFNAPGAFYVTVEAAPPSNAFYLTPPKVIQGSGSIVIGAQQPLPKMVGPIIPSGI